MNNKLVFFCHQCKKVSRNLSDFLFVEEDVNRSFCSDKCIEDFFSPIVSFYDSEEKKFRHEIQIQEKHLSSFLADDDKIDEILSTPDEIWVQENELGEKIYSLIKQFKLDEKQSFHMIILSFMYASKPSFILFMTATQDKKILELFQKGKKTEMTISSSSDSNMLQIDAETLGQLENKKSNILADMLERRSPADIPYESFQLYEEYLDHTMQSPDEIFRQNDEEGDEIFVYIKAQVKDTITFYYIVISYVYRIDNSPKKETLIPILSFPTLDGELYNHYKKGEIVQGVLKN